VARARRPRVVGGHGGPPHRDRQTRTLPPSFTFHRGKSETFQRFQALPLGSGDGYDSLNNVMSESDSYTGDSVSYGYDYNGRRISMASTMNGVPQPTVNYAYDCDDQLVQMSNNGTLIGGSCGPGNLVVSCNINGETQIQFCDLPWLHGTAVFGPPSGGASQGVITAGTNRQDG
jgi:hypothetical protein